MSRTRHCAQPGVNRISPEGCARDLATDAHRLPLDFAINDPRYGLRRSRHARSCYHSRHHPITSLDALSRRDRRVLHNLLRPSFCRPRRAQPPIGAQVVSFFRQKELQSAVPAFHKKNFLKGGKN